MKIYKPLIILITFVSVNNSFAQARKTEELLRRVADHVIAQTSYKFINTKTQEKFTSVDGVAPSADIRAESPFNKWFYPMGVLAIGMTETSSVLGERKYRDYAEHNYAFVFDHAKWFEDLNTKNKHREWETFFAMNDLDACGALAAGLSDVNSVIHRKDFQEYINKAVAYVSNKQMRSIDRTLIRSSPRKNTLWADDLYMSVPLLARAGKMTGNAKYFDDAILQVENFTKYLYNPQTGLYYHCYYTDNGQNGVAQWGRCNGWLAVAQVELLNQLPERHSKIPTLIKLLERQITGFSRYQDTSGLWHQLLDKPDSYLETSVTAMFVYAVARAVNKGWIPKTYICIAQDGWEGLSKKVDQQGRIADVCVGTGTSENLRMYYSRPKALNDTHVLGAFLLAGDEMLTYQINNRKTK